MGLIRCLLIMTAISYFLPLSVRATEILPAETEPAQAQESVPEPSVPGPGLYFGLLHSHSNLSQGTESAEYLFSQAASTEGVDFFALTDNSDSLDNPDSLANGTDSQDWLAGKAAASAATNSRFVGIFGFEMNWNNNLGHIGTFCTPGFVSWRQEEFSQFRTGLQNFYAALSGVEDAIGQFHHPGSLLGDFRDFAFWSPEIDRVMALLEVGSPDHADTYSFYDQALSKGWHVAPANNNPHCRTVVYAQFLTEEGIFDAIRQRRVYATEDTDLSIHYSMDGHLLGSRLKKWQLGDTADILVTLSDPTDAIGTVEVIGEVGISLVSQIFEDQWATAEFSLPTNQRYYYIRVTQPDGDVAVTAPVWVESEEYAGIRGLAQKTELPVQGQPVELELELYNQESALFTLQKTDIYVDGFLHSTLTENPQIWQGSAVIPFSLTLDTPGKRNITVTVTADLGGAARQYTAYLSLSIRMPEMVTSLLVDGIHGNFISYAQLSALAVENNISIRKETTEITQEMLQNSSIFLIPGPNIPFSEDFINMVREYVDYGGTILMTEGNGESNRLLETLGSSLRFGENSGVIQYLTDFQAASPWCANLLPGQLYRCSGSVLAAPEHWIVEGALASENRIFIGSGPWLSDEALAEPKNIWDSPNANRRILQNILGSSETVIPLTAIADLRGIEEGQLCRIRGYVTANAFADVLYVQDNTGGIAVADFPGTKLPVGTAVEIQGIPARNNKNPVLKVISYKLLDVSPYRYLPAGGAFSELMNNELHGGDLVQVEGEVVSFRMDENGAIRELVLEQDGQFAAVYIDEGIVSNSVGYNDLVERVKTGRIFRAVGLVYLREDGTSVVRVRNCDEVVYVPVLQYYWEPCQPDNPQVGDGIGFWILAMLLSAAFLRKTVLCKPCCK